MEILKGKKVIILGGSSGIGLATAIAAAAEGALVTIVSGNQQRIDAALTTLPTGTQGFSVNMTDEQQIAHFFKQAGQFDHLVYTAGEALQLVNIADVSVTDAREFFNIRYWGAFTAVKYATPHINKSGSIVLTGGVAAARPGKGWSLGASICAAMEGFTRAMAVELAPVRVNLVSPGIVKTNLWSGMATEDRDGMYAHFSQALPVQFVADANDLPLPDETTL